MNDREARMKESQEELEQDMELLGITGVEGRYIIMSYIVQTSFKMKQL